jgi:chromosome segregation ATPase
MDYQEEGSLWDFDIEEFLEESQRSERQRLEKELERISEQLENREEIHQEALNELESKLDWYKDRLEKLYKQGRGRKGKRGELKNQIQKFYQSIREEKYRCWKDRQRLEERKGEKIRELSEVEEGDIFDLIDEL